MASSEEEIPQILDFLEGEVPDDAFLFGEISLADIAVDSFFRNDGFARFTVDAQRWPKIATFVSFVLSHDALARLRVRGTADAHIGGQIGFQTFGSDLAFFARDLRLDLTLITAHT